MAILKVTDIHVYYGSIHAVKGVSFEVNQGEIVTLIGANGAGKSTVLNTVAGLLHPRSGSVEFEGEDLKGIAAHKIVERGLAQVPEGRRVFLQMTVEENLEMGAYTRPNSEIPDSIADVYERFPRLKERRTQIAGTLSGGEQQMLAMGRALMSKPKLLMLDEPSMGLAPILVEQIFDIIRELHRSGTTILLVEQNAQAALAIADRAYVLETGNITNSVNLPSVSLPRTPGMRRACVIHLNVSGLINRITSVISAGGGNIENMISGSRKEYAYTIFDLSGNVPADLAEKLDAVPDVIRSRVI